MKAKSKRTCSTMSSADQIVRALRADIKKYVRDVFLEEKMTGRLFFVEKSIETLGRGHEMLFTAIEKLERRAQNK